MSHARSSTLLLLALTMAAAPGCKDKKKNEPATTDGAVNPAHGELVASCDKIAVVGVCSEYTAEEVDRRELTLSDTCVKLKGTWAKARCPNTSLIGTCRTATGEVRSYYHGPVHTEDSARRDCGVYGGAWTAKE
jgi:hypothetical protein